MSRKRSALLVALSLLMCAALTSCKDGSASEDPYKCSNADSPFRLMTACPNPGLPDPTSLPSGYPMSMVAFGDSFSAGEGAPQPGIYSAEGGAWKPASGFTPGTDEASPKNACHRSNQAYPALVATALDLNLDFRACSGAVASDFFISQDDRFLPDSEPIAPQRGSVIRSQIVQVPSNTALATVGFGGNDVSFAPLVKACIYGGALDSLILSSLAKIIGDKWQDGDCKKFAEGLLVKMPELLQVYSAPDVGTGINAVFADIRAAVPEPGRVIAVSYPRLFPAKPSGKCSLGTGSPVMSVDEQLAINDVVIALNGYIRGAADQAGIDFVDMTDTFVGLGVAANTDQDHGLCRDSGSDTDQTDRGERWVNRFRLDNPWTDVEAKLGSVHPNRQGHEEFATRVLACFNDREQCSNAPASTEPTAITPDQDNTAAGDERYAGYDGLWGGTVATDSIEPKPDYTVVVQIDASADSFSGASMYPEYGCGGPLTDPQIDGSTLIVTENPVLGAERCSVAPMYLTAADGFLIYRVKSAAGHEYTGTLARIDPETTSVAGSWSGQFDQMTATGQGFLSMELAGTDKLVGTLENEGCTADLAEVVRIGSGDHGYLYGMTATNTGANACGASMDLVMGIRTPSGELGVLFFEGNSTGVATLGRR